MTQDKELLLKDLCSRLPYGVKCYGYCFKIDGNHCECYGTLDSIKLGVWYPFHLSNRISINNGATYEETFSDIKPYLFPLSSMTEEQQEEFDRIYADDMQVVANNLKNRLDGKPYETNLGHYRHIDWLNANHYDYRGLISKGIAIDATGLNIY